MTKREFIEQYCLSRAKIIPNLYIGQDILAKDASRIYDAINEACREIEKEPEHA